MFMLTNKNNNPNFLVWFDQTLHPGMSNILSDLSLQVKNLRQEFKMPIMLLVGPTVFRGKNLTNSAVNLVNSAAHRGKADEIPRFTAVTQLNFRGLIKS